MIRHRSTHCAGAGKVFDRVSGYVCVCVFGEGGGESSEASVRFSPPSSEDKYTVLHVAY